jgi:hypothetical protein
MAAHGNNIEPQPRQGRPNLSHPDRVATMRQREEIRHLPETDCPALVPDCERMHLSAVSETCERTTHALARDLYASAISRRLSHNKPVPTVPFSRELIYQRSSRGGDLGPSALRAARGTSSPAPLSSCASREGVRLLVAWFVEGIRAFWREPDGRGVDAMRAQQALHQPRVDRNRCESATAPQKRSGSLRPLPSPGTLAENTHRCQHSR